MKRNVALWLFVILIPVFAENNIAVLDLYSPNIGQAEVIMLSEILRAELINSGHFNVMERNQMNEILKEQGYQASGCMNDKCAVEIGQLIGANSIVASSIGFVEESCVISLRIINIKTGQIDKIIEYNFIGSLSDAVSYGIKNAVLKLAGKAISQNNVGNNENNILLQLKKQHLNKSIYTIDQEIIAKIEYLNRESPTNVKGWRLQLIKKNNYLAKYEFNYKNENMFFCFEILTNPWSVKDLHVIKSLAIEYGLNYNNIESLATDLLDEALQFENAKPNK